MRSPEGNLGTIDAKVKEGTVADKANKNKWTNIAVDFKGMIVLVANVNSWKSASIPPHNLLNVCAGVEASVALRHNAVFISKSTWHSEA